MNHAHRLVVGLLALGGAGCFPGPFGARAWTGDHIEFWTTDDATVCGGSFAALDNHAERITRWAASRGVKAHRDVYRYYWLSPEERDEVTVCPDDRAGCFLRSPRKEAIFLTGYSEHEVVHPEIATGHASFADEGLATMLGGFFVETNNSKPSVATILNETAGKTLEGHIYDRAGTFVRAIDDLYPDVALSALLTTRRSDDFARFSSRLDRAGIDVDAVLDHDVAKRACDHPNARIPLSDCDISPAPWRDADHWSTTGRVDCDDGNTVGPAPVHGDQSRSGLIWARRAFEVPKHGPYTLGLTSHPGTGAHIIDCDPRACDPDVPHKARLVRAGETITLEFEAGKRYILQINRALDKGPADFTLDLDFAPDWQPEDPPLDCPARQQAAVRNNECPPPLTPEFVAGNVSVIPTGTGGFGPDAAWSELWSNRYGFELARDELCLVHCISPPNHPCFTPEAHWCPNPDTQSPLYFEGCLLCTDTTEHDCTTQVDAACKTLPP